MLPTLPAAVEEATLAIGSEAMTNAVRHSGATRCLVTLCVGTPAAGEELTLAVHDDGRGLSAASHAGSGTGLGLRGMRRRAVDIGGSYSIGAGPAGGTEVRASFPLTVPS